MNRIDSQLTVGLFAVLVSWITKRVVERLVKNTGLPDWTDEVAAGIVGVVFSSAAMSQLSKRANTDPP